MATRLLAMRRMSRFCSPIVAPISAYLQQQRQQTNKRTSRKRGEMEERGKTGKSYQDFTKKSLRYMSFCYCSHALFCHGCETRAPTDTKCKQPQGAPIVGQTRRACNDQTPNVPMPHRRGTGQNADTPSGTFLGFFCWFPNDFIVVTVGSNHRGMESNWPNQISSMQVLK